MHSPKVLILEDNPFQLMALHQMLNANQVFDVLTAQCVDSAMSSLAHRGPVDIAICDLQMEGCDGLSLISHLAASGQADAVVILSSADASVLNGAAQLARQQGLDVLGVVQKPASANCIGELLGRWIRDTSHVPQDDSAMFSSRGGRRPLSPGPLVNCREYSSQWKAYFQPKVRGQGQLAGVEALARWQHPTQGLLNPGQFLDALEKAGLIPALTWHMLDAALELSRDVLNVSGCALPVAVNISPVMLEQPDFVQRLLSMLERYALCPHVLTLEVVEQSAGQLAVAPFESLLRLRMAGCRLSIDDFGTGASNIRRLLDMPFSELKIPAEFVNGLSEDSRKSAVVDGALVMARQMQLDVVVEGVETQADYEALLLLGDPIIQGYFIARPMPRDQLLDWLHQAGHYPDPLLPRRAISPDHAPVNR